MRRFNFTDEVIMDVVGFFAKSAKGSTALEFNDDKYSTIAYMSGRFPGMRVDKAFVLVQAIASAYYGIRVDDVDEETLHRINFAVKEAKIREGR